MWYQGMISVMSGWFADTKELISHWSKARGWLCSKLAAQRQLSAYYGAFFFREVPRVHFSLLWVSEYRKTDNQVHFPSVAG